MKRRGYSVDRLIAAMAAEPSPCDECRHRVRCGQSQLACMDFRLHLKVHQAHIPGPDHKRQPNRSHYRRAFAGADD